jgi:putative ATP-binding cassette transporter
MSNSHLGSALRAALLYAMPVWRLARWLLRAALPYAMPVWRLARWVVTIVVSLVSFGSVDLSSKHLDKGALARIWGFLWPFLISTEKAAIVIPRTITLPSWQKLFAGSWVWVASAYALMVAILLGFGGLVYAIFGLSGASATAGGANATAFLTSSFWQSVLGFWLDLSARGPVLLEVLAVFLIYCALSRNIAAGLTKWRARRAWNQTAGENDGRVMISLPFGGTTLATYPEWLRTWSLFAAIGFGTWLVNHFAVEVNAYNRIFMDSITQKDQAQFMQVLLDFARVLAIYTLVGPVYKQIKNIQILDWVKFTTRDLMRRWVSGGKQYAISLLGAVDNPNQRIEESPKTMCPGVMGMIFNLMDSAITLYLFTGVLWDIEAELSYSTDIFGPTIVLDHLVLYTLVIYSIFGTNGAAIVGRALIPLRAKLAELMSYFRVSTVFIEKQAEAIAAYRGEGREYDKAYKRYLKAVDVSYVVYSWQRNLAFFTGAYSRAAAFLPYVVLAPFFFAGKITFGAITQAAGACESILDALSVIVSSFDTIADTLSAVTRCGELKEALAAVEAEAARQDRPRIAYSEPVMPNTTLLAVDDMTLYTPFGQQLIVSGLTLALKRGDRVLLRGPSGSGKTSILRAIRRLPYWDWGTGEIRHAKGARVIALSQLAYVHYEEPLRNQLSYPAADASDEELIAILEKVQLGKWLREKLANQLLTRSIADFAHLTPEAQKRELAAATAKWDATPVAEQHRLLLDATINWDLSMSGGERQRLMLGRALANKVDLIVADEPTSGLDDDTTVALYKLLAAAKLTMLTVTHNKVLLPFHHRVLQLSGDGKGGWSEMPASQCQW